MSTFETFFTTQDLRHFAKQLCTTDLKTQKESRPEKNIINFQCHAEKEKYDCLAGLELQKQIIYAFAKNKQFDSQIDILMFRKKDGIKEKTTLSDINGTITAMRFIHFKTGKAASSNSSTFKLVVGFNEGFIKVIDLADAKISGLRLDVKPIVSIIPGDYRKFHNLNVCVILAQDSYIYFFDIATLTIVYILRPNIVTCDKAISIQINQQYSFLMQVTRGGYIIFWRMCQILNHFKQFSKTKVEKQFNVLPLRVNHSIAIDGIIACFFYGHIIALITKSGLFKLVAINVKAEEQFVFLTQYKISDAQSITSACFYPNNDSVFIAKSKEGQGCYIQRLLINEDLNISTSTKFSISSLDAIHEFYLPANSSILMCRGQKTYGIGYCQSLFSIKPRLGSHDMQKISDY